MFGFTDEALILKKADRGEADRLLTAFTRNHGKLRVLARGVRRPVSRKGGNLDLLTHTKFHLRQTRGIYLVTEAESLESFFRLKKEIKNISKAYYLCELVDRLCPAEQALPFVFDSLISVLRELPRGGNRIINEFEREVLAHLGFIDIKTQRKKFRPLIEELVEQELKTPNFYYALLNLD